MVEYKWIALSNTTIGVLMASIDSTIVLISLPAIFRGIEIDPLTSFQYLLWLLFGYSVVTSTLLVTFGRISDMFGRVKLYNLGFAIFTVGSTLLYLTPNTGDLGAQELIVFRIIQGIGGAFLFANGTAIITDAFPAKERGRALGINLISVLAGSTVGLVLGGVLAAFDWRYVFLVSVPVGIIGTVWSYWKLKETAVITKNQKLDLWGNVTFGLGLTLLLVGISYGLIPYGSASTGWSDPWVIASMVAGGVLLLVFPFIELRVPEPMFDLKLFANRNFVAANVAGLLASIARGGVQIMLIILLQGIWLPLHGYSYSSTPFWSGIFILPLLAGFVVMGPVSGALADRFGAKLLTTVGMGLTAASFYALTFLPYNFSYLPFALIILVMGIGSGMFAAPNVLSIMNAVPPHQRGAASGMRATLQNTGQTISIAIFFTILVSSLTGSLPGAFSSAMTTAGFPQLTPYFNDIPATSAVFAAFLGYNPVGSILATMPTSVTASIPANTVQYLTGTTFFPTAIAPAFMSALSITFYIGIAISVVAMIISYSRGGIFVYEAKKAKQEELIALSPSSPPTPIPVVRRSESALRRVGEVKARS
ncbi:MAG: MFS transporter [Thaumarchaeota archaeon]|nr:MFS transporter [Nitrososphaerota archaeon]